jgi:hypothetical protein
LGQNGSTWNQGTIGSAAACACALVLGPLPATASSPAKPALINSFLECFI